VRRVFVLGDLPTTLAHGCSCGSRLFELWLDSVSTVSRRSSSVMLCDDATAVMLDAQLGGGTLEDICVVRRSREHRGIRPAVVTGRAPSMTRRLTAQNLNGEVERGHHTAARGGSHGRLARPRWPLCCAFAFRSPLVNPPRQSQASLGPVGVERLRAEQKAAGPIEGVLEIRPSDSTRGGWSRRGGARRGRDRPKPGGRAGRGGVDGAVAQASGAQHGERPRGDAAPRYGGRASGGRGGRRPRPRSRP